MQRGGLRNIKVKPPTFNGKQGENVKNFFSKLEKYLEVQQVADDEKIEAAGLCFESYALEHYDALLRTNENIRYEEMKEEMITRFDEDKIDIVIRSRINKRRLKQNETVQTYYNELKREADKVEMSEDAFLFSFIQGLPSDIMKQVVLQNPTNPNEALSIAKTLEQMNDLSAKSGLEAMKEAKIAATQNNYRITKISRTSSQR